ncbi:reverse transcriptase domain-containing protein [Catellatospora sp. NPDC049111]|uniref:reverse transcriptase domain-containing protein n=1 Tax=Catellatospora sp. NPDC049111 TaxID=3155271 RepID=UPI0033E0AC09
MRSDSTTQFVTAVKLRELRAQHSRLREAYDRLTLQAEAATDPHQRLRHLYRGLADLTYAGGRVHPELADLGVLANDTLPGQGISADLVERWSRRLADELTAGRLRSEFVFRFGVLLEQWATSGDSLQRIPPTRQLHELREHVLTPPRPNDHRGLIENLLAGVSEADPAKDHIVATREDSLQEALSLIHNDQYQPARLRAEARRLIQDHTLSAELADVLTLLGTGPDALQWPAGGVVTRAAWTRNKWRLYTDQDLPTTCLLDVLARRWERELSDVFGDWRQRQAADHRSELLWALNVPKSVTDGEQQFAGSAGRQSDPETIPWIADLGTARDPQARAGFEFIHDDPYRKSVLAQRRAHLDKLHEVTAVDPYEQDSDMFFPVVALVNAEIKLARAAFPDRPLCVVKLDLRDYYSSIPHDLVLTILAGLGIRPPELDLVAGFLAMPLAATDGSGSTGDLGETRSATRGVPMGYRLSALLAELIGRCMETYVQQRAAVRVIRVVDDICLLTPDPDAAVAAREHVTAFFRTCGLTLNDDKFGAVCIGGELPAAMAGPLPRWGMLTLDQRGEWSVHEAGFQQHLAQSRGSVMAAEAVLSKVDIINADLTHLARCIALGADLGDDHRAEANAALVRFVDDYVGPGQGIADALCKDVIALVGARTDADRQTPPQAIPEAWLYWPVTAGGLGLRNPYIMAGQFAEAVRRRDRVAVPPGPAEAGWNTRDNDWARYYRQLLKPLDPAAPTDTAATESLTRDFIARGTTISQGAQLRLTPYWRWILSVYGPEIRERFGTFRFLNTELVPLQLLGARRTDSHGSNDSRGTNDDPWATADVDNPPF